MVIIMSELKSYIVLYRYRNDEEHFLDEPLAYQFMAEDYDHAEEQFYNAEPDNDIIWVVQTDDYNLALENYYNNGEE